MPIFGFHLRPGAPPGRAVTRRGGSPGRWGHRLEPPRIAPGRFSFQLEVSRLTSKVPEDPERSRAGLWLAPGEAGHPRSDCRRALHAPMCAALACGRARLPSEVHRRWARRDPSDNALSPGKPVPACRGHSKIEPGTCAAWEAHSGTWRISVMITPSRDLPASTEGGDRERERRAWRERKVGRNWSRRRLFLFFATAARISLTS